ncbi:MAG: hypothetical protein RIB78_02110 [Gammaproteobacteria bacterium]
MKSKQKNTLTLIVIVVAFLGPIAFSYWLTGQQEVLDAQGNSNYGDLVTPLRPVDDLKLLDPVANREYQLHGKWNLVYVTDVCEQACMNNLYRMRQIHIAMDKHSLRVQRVLLMTQAQSASLMPELNEYAGQRVIVEPGLDKDLLLRKFEIGNSDSPIEAQRLYIIDPLGNLMMSYPPDINPRGIMKDLKKLLKFSRIG